MDDITSLLDSSIDDLADLPEFKPFPAGTHRAIFNYESKKVNDAACIELSFKALETIELADPVTDAPVVPGTETSVLYQLHNPFAQGKLKPLVRALATHHGVASIGEALEASRGMEVTVVTKVRSNKEKTQTYTDVVALLV